MTDRNVIYPDGSTIFWKDFIAFIVNNDDSNIRDMGALLNRELLATDEKGEQHLIRTLSFLARSIIKLQSLGALQYDFITTAGNSSPTYIDRFHLTFFGQKILEYIDVESVSDS